MDTSNSSQQIIDLYKTLLQQENSNHTVFISVLIGFAIILLAATWWWNKWGVNRYIKTTVTQEFEGQRESFENLVKTSVENNIQDIDKRFKKVEFNLYRSFAFSIRGNQSYSHSVFYWAMAIDRGIELDEGELIRTYSKVIIEELKKNTAKQVHGLEYIKEVVQKFPYTLTKEKNEILKLLKEFSEYEPLLKE